MLIEVKNIDKHPFAFLLTFCLQLYFFVDKTSTRFKIIFYEHYQLHVIITFGGIILGEFSFGERLKQLRKEHNLTQEALAEKLLTVRSTINKYEKNTRKPEYETLIKIADLFNTTTDYLLGRTNKK